MRGEAIADAAAVMRPIGGVLEYVDAWQYSPSSGEWSSGTYYTRADDALREARGEPAGVEITPQQEIESARAAAQDFGHGI